MALRDVKLGGRETIGHIEKVVKKYNAYGKKITILNIWRALKNQKKNGKIQKKCNWPINI